MAHIQVGEPWSMVKVTARRAWTSLPLSPQELKRAAVPSTRGVMCSYLWLGQGLLNSLAWAQSVTDARAGDTELRCLSAQTLEALQGPPKGRKPDTGGTPDAQDQLLTINCNSCDQAKETAETEPVCTHRKAMGCQGCACSRLAMC